MSDFFGSGLSNMKAVTNEIDIINSNITGANITAYKSTSHSYSGTGAISNGALQTPDTSLISGHTSLDFSQGQLINSGTDTDFAIQGEGFFLLQNYQDVGTQTPNLVSRDGEFKFSTIDGLGTVLTNYSGLLVLDQSLNPITKDDFYNNNARPAVVMPDSTLDSLKLSGLDSTVYDLNGSTFSAGTGQLQQSTLETSNTDMAQSLAALSYAKKKFDAMAAQIKEEQSRLDIIINLIK